MIKVITLKEYVLGVVFSFDKKEILLMKRKKDPYNGLINGIGGKVESTETHLAAMKREFGEESGLSIDSIKEIEHMMSISFPEEILHAYFIKLKTKVNLVVEENHEGTYFWEVITNKLLDCNNNDLAGEGSLSYFIKFAQDIYIKDEN